MYIYLYNGDILKADTIEFSNVAPEVIINGSSSVPLIEILRIKDSNAGYFGVVRWHNDDIVAALIERGIETTEENINAVRDAIENGHGFKDAMIEQGWIAMDSIICDLLVRSGEEGDA